MTFIDNLPAEAQPIARAMANGEMLGAARNIDAILEVLESVARHAGDDAAEYVREVARHYRATRGAESAAVTNVLELLMAGLPERGLAAWVAAFGARMKQRQAEWLDEMAKAAVEALADAHTLLAYDYSSSVAEVLRRKCQRDPEVELLIPESRTLDGGRPYVAELNGLPGRITFLSDGAIGQMTRRADVVLEGVETLCEDGSFYNTIGSLTCAVCAAHYDVPYYAVTSTLKIARGVSPDDVEAGAPRRFAETYGELPGAGTEYVENEWVPASLVSGVITERGLLAPDQVRSAAEDFFANSPVQIDQW